LIVLLSFNNDHRLGSIKDINALQKLFGDLVHRVVGETVKIHAVVGAYKVERWGAVLGS